MTFAYPWVLLFLVAPVLLIFWTVRRRAAGVVLPFDHEEHGHKRALGGLLRGFELVPSLILIVAVVFLARPQMLRVPRQERVLTNIQICMDVSGSMSAEDRYEMAADAIRRFTLAREGDAMGFTLFGSYQIRWTPLTKDLKVIRRALPFADPLSQPPGMGGTSIGAALRFCRDNMLTEAEEGDRLLILVSDGVSSDLGGSAPQEIITELLDAQIVVYHVHVGSGQVPSEMTDIAVETGGEAFVATDAGGLEQIFRHIDLMRPDRFKPAASVPTDEHRPFAFAGLALLGVHLVGLLGMRYTPW